jgi:hypothetical protein
MELWREIQMCIAEPVLSDAEGLHPSYEFCKSSGVGWAGRFVPIPIALIIHLKYEVPYSVARIDKSGLFR